MQGKGSSKLKVAVLLSGRGSNFEALAKESYTSDFEIAVVLSDQPGARGVTVAQDMGFPVEVVTRRAKELNNQRFNQELVTVLRRYNPGLVVLAGFMRIIDSAFIDAFFGNVLNIHPSLLPNFRGAKAQEKALIAGVTESGCTVHFVTEEVDAGPIIAQRKVPVLSGDTTESLSARILAEEQRILPAAVQAFARGDYALTAGKPRRILWSDSVQMGPLGDFISKKG